MEFEITNEEEASQIIDDLVADLQRVKNLSIEDKAVYLKDIRISVKDVENYYNRWSIRDR